METEFANLSIIFNNCQNESKFPHEWTKANIIPVPWSPYIRKEKSRIWKTKGESLYSFCRKIFECLIFNEMLTFFTENNLISPNQSGFRPGDSCCNQLVATAHKIYKLFDEAFEVRGVFLNISKAFDKVWHEGLLLKLNQNGIFENLLKLAQFSCRKQRVVLNGEHHASTHLGIMLPQGFLKAFSSKDLYYLLFT